jgi:hypothetical protein
VAKSCANRSFVKRTREHRGLVARLYSHRGSERVPKNDHLSNAIKKVQKIVRIVFEERDDRRLVCFNLSCHRTRPRPFIHCHCCVGAYKRWAGGFGVCVIVTRVGGSRDVERTPTYLKTSLPFCTVKPNEDLAMRDLSFLGVVWTVYREVNLIRRGGERSNLAHRRRTGCRS